MDFLCDKGVIFLCCRFFVQVSFDLENQHRFKILRSLYKELPLFVLLWFHSKFVHPMKI